MKTRSCVLWLALLFVAIVVLNIVWFAHDDRPPIWDMAVHLATALDFYNVYTHFTFKPADFKTLLLLGKFYPPLFPALMGLFFLIFHPSIYVGPAANLVPLAILMWSTFKIGQKLFSDKVGLVAAFLAATYPLMAWLPREALLDFSLAAVVAAAAWMYLESENFSNRKFSILFGVVAALGFLTKHNFLFYALALGIFALLQMFVWEERTWPPRRKRLLNFIASQAITAFGAALWYIPHGSDVLEYLRINRQLHTVLQQPTYLTAPSLLYTLNALTETQIHLIPFVALLWGIWISARKYARRASILYFCGFGPLVIMTFSIAHREVRMGVASLPFLAVLTAAGLMEIRRPVLRRALITGLVAWVALEFELLSFGIPRWPQSVTVLRSNALTLNVWEQSYAGIVGHPQKENWKIVDMLEAARADSLKHGEAVPNIGIVPDMPRFNHFDFILLARLKGIEAEPGRVAALPEVSPEQYLVIKSGDQGEAGTTRHNGEINQWIIQHPDRFEQIDVFALPDGSTASVYRAKNSNMNPDVR
ncbi:MAG: glycosyltransferase family 39 protein [Acidobacteriia bacterium]|nr:glycosyltransferase family 39 protein [Terriglobia bacterium]